MLNRTDAVNSVKVSCYIKVQKSDKHYEAAEVGLLPPCQKSRFRICVKDESSNDESSLSFSVSSRKVKVLIRGDQFDSC